MKTFVLFHGPARVASGRLRVVAAAVGLIALVLTGAASAQTVTDYPIPTAGSLPYGITAGPDGNLWFCEFGSNKIGKIDPVSHVITEYPIPTTPGSLFSIAAGPDGNLWFTDGAANKIGKIDPVSHVITEYPIPTANAWPAGIAAGPDGNLWFTENLGYKIGRISTGGVILGEYPVPNLVGTLYGIVAGPDGAMWFVEHDGNKIGRIDMTGAVHDFDIPTAFTQTEDITVGSDGNLWFAEFQASKIGRMTTAGVVTEFQIPIPAAGATLPSGIAAGPDGNIWFTESLVHKIGRITTAGVISEYPIPTTPATPVRITVGPDGALWFTEEAGNKIGRITTGTSCPAIALSPTTLPDGTAGFAYTPTTLTPTSGTPPYTFHIPGLPDGMTYSPVSPANGPSVTIAGTPAASFSGTIPVTGTDANGCPFTQNYHLYIDTGFTVVSITPRSGPAAGGTSIGIDGTEFLNGATVTIGGVPATGVVVQSATHIDVVTPPLAPGVLNDVVVTNPGPATATLGEAFFADFLDVPQSDPFHGVIEKLVRNKIAAGCGPGIFCPNMYVQRGPAMVLILAAKHGPGWPPPPATGTVFVDVPLGSFAAAWIEAAFAEGITAGCQAGYFCPGDAIDRKQAAVLLLAAKHGAGWTPPSATGFVFFDVPPTAPLADWIEEFAHEGITAGCGYGYFCPDYGVPRKQMAAFLVATFALP